MRHLLSFSFLAITAFSLPLFSAEPEILRLDRPKPWVENLPPEFKQNFAIGLYKKTIMVNSRQEVDTDAEDKNKGKTLTDTDAPEVTEPPLSWPGNIFYSASHGDVYAIEKDQIAWAVSMDPFECGKEARCIAIMGKQRLLNGVMSQPYVHYRVNKKNPEANQVVQCEMLNTTRKNDTIKLSECSLYSLKTCTAWNDYRSKNIAQYEKFKYNRHNLTVTRANYTQMADTIDNALVTLRKDMAAIFKVPTELNMKRSLSKITRGDTQLRWEPLIKITPISVGSSMIQLKDLLAHEETCAKYQTFFMTDAQRDIWNRAHPSETRPSGVSEGID